MATYAIGDVQGCYAPLRALVSAIAFDPALDRLWIAGDLVNRGPASADVLRWARDQGDAVTVVLGNHDIYLIARALGAVTPRARDTLDALLDAPDAEVLVEWLRRQPLLHHQDNWVMVHAALHPSWTLADAAREARALEALLRGDRCAEFLRASYDPPATYWSEDLVGADRATTALAIMTRLRCLAPDGALTFDYTGKLGDIPVDRVPWWRVATPRSTDVTVIAGHWAALGYHREPGLLAVDTGCAWGHRLTAVCLEDGAVTQVTPEGQVSRSSR